MTLFNVREHRNTNPINNGQSNELPVGHYRVLVEEISDKKSSTGFDMITFKIRILDSISGRFVNGLHWENVMLDHDNEMTRRIARDRMANLLEAHGIDEFESIPDLANKIGTKKVTLTVSKTERGRTIYTYRKESFYFDRRDGVTGLQVANRVKMAAATPTPAADQLSPEEIPVPPFDPDAELDF